MHTVLIADDEPLARRKLREHVAGVDWLECVGETADGTDTIDSIDELRPDLVFLDIRMPGATGLEVLEQVVWTPHVIFTTAFDQYAVAAFELQALDYLVKPFGRDRIDRALSRVRRILSFDQAARTATQARVRDALGTGRYLTRLFVRNNDRIVPVALADVDRFEARGDYVAVRVGGRAYLITVGLKELGSRLDPERFVQIHRSHIVNMDRVRAMRPYEGSRLEFELEDGSRVIASRARSRVIRGLSL